MTKNSNVLVIIPAYNEEKNLPRLFDELKLYPYDILVINDCSSDTTEEILQNSHINHLNLSLNVGLAGVTQMGFKYADENAYDVAVVIDGDGQHSPKYISALISEIDNGYDYVIGSRFVSEKKPYTLRMVGSRILCFFIKVKTRKTIHDPTSGMRALSKKLIHDFAENMNFIAEPDAVTYILKKDYKVKEVQVQMMERREGVSYFHNPMKSIKYMYDTIISILFLQ